MNGSLKLMVDTTIIVEALKGNRIAKGIIEEIINSQERASFYVNPFVMNELVFILTVYLSGLSPKTLKKKKEIVRKVMKEEIKEKILPFVGKFFIYLSFDLKQNEITYELCEKYGLLPTDATVLATCKHYEVPHLISFDSDFREACEREGIVLVDTPEKLREILSGRGI